MLKKNIVRVFLIIVFVAVLQVITTIILARLLPKPEFGLYRLALTIIELGSVAGLLGIDHSLVRFFSTPSVRFDLYDWKGFLRRFSIAPVFIILLLVIVTGSIYKFDLYVTSFIAVCLAAVTSILVFSSFLRARQEFEPAVFFGRMNFVLFLVFLLAVYAFKVFTFKNVILAYLLAVVVSNVAVVSYCLKTVPCGSRPLPAALFKNGFYYFGIAVSILLLVQTSILFISKMLSYRDVAIYVAIASVMRLFEFVQDSTYFVLTPYINSSSRPKIREMIAGLCGLGLAIAAGYFLFGRLLVNWLFGGLYNEGAYLIPFFIGIGFVRTLFVLPASFIGGRCSEKILRNQLFVFIFTAALNCVLTYFFIGKWQIKGAAMASLISWTVLLVLTSVGIRQYLVKE